jgi:hypothetical protein
MNVTETVKYEPSLLLVIKIAALFDCTIEIISTKDRENISLREGLSGDLCFVVEGLLSSEGLLQTDGRDRT